LQAGDPVAQLSNLELQSQAARVHSDLQLANARTVQAELHYSGMGPAEHLRDQLTQQDRFLNEQVSQLRLRSPLSGIVVTPRPSDLRGSYLPAGREVAEVADISTMLARIFVPEFAMRDIHLGAPVKLLPASLMSAIPGRIDSVAPAAAQIDPSLANKSNLQGINLPDYYLATVRFRNQQMNREGEAGTAKIFVRRRSLAGFGWEYFHDMLTHRVW